MSRVERDPERGRAAAAKLKALGAKAILVKAAEQGYITQLACKMPECFCPEELGGACYFEPVTDDWGDWRSDWMPTVEHFPVYRKDGGKETVDNGILAHRLCNRLDHSLRVGRSHGRDKKPVGRRLIQRGRGRGGGPWSTARAGAAPEAPPARDRAGDRARDRDQTSSAWVVSIDTPIQVLSLLGLALFLLLAGLEVEYERFRGRPLRLTVFAYGISFGLPLLIGLGLSAAGLVKSPLLVAIAPPEERP